jgi:hypothetical protein
MTEDHSPNTPRLGVISLLSYLRMPRRRVMVNRVDWRVDPVLVFHSVPLLWYVSYIA